MIIAIAGTNGAGKDEAARYLEGKGFSPFSLSDELRELARQRGQEPTREYLQQLGNEVRATFGDAHLTKLVLEHSEGKPHLVISSIRNLGELEPVRTTDGFKLLFIDAPVKLRYERAIARGRVGEGFSLEEFAALEEKELNAGAGKQNLAELREAADAVIDNDGSVEELHRKLGEAIGNLSERHRLSWDEYFMQIAHTVATRSTCDRKYVGAVLVRDRVILSTGYNGSISGTPHCDEVGHMIVGDPPNEHCVRTIHAEINAIAQAARNGVNISGATLYVTCSPCWECFKVLANSGIRRICYGEFYRDERVLEAAAQIGVEMVDLSGAL
jgi:dCMP deaminase